MSYYKCRKIETAIRNARLDLIELANEKGVAENFGRSEIIKIQNDFIDPTSYTDEMNNRRVQLNNFIDWCQNYRL